MSIALSSLFVVFGLTILVFGGEFFVKGSIQLAQRTGIPQALIALTVVAFGTSAPELFTSLIAAIENAPDVSIGNVVGSNIFNLLVIIGITSFLTVNRATKQTLTWDWPFLIISAGLLWYFTKDLEFSRAEGLISLFILVLFLTASYYKTRSHKSPPTENLPHWIKDPMFLLGGLMFLTIGAKITLEGAVDFGKLFGLSDRVIGLTIISAGTGLPELVTSAVAAYRGHNDIAISNIIGSNILNSMLVLGITASILPLKVNPSLFNTDLPWMIGSFVGLFILIILFKGKISKPIGLISLLSYFIYLYILLK